MLEEPKLGWSNWWEDASPLLLFSLSPPVQLPASAGRWSFILVMAEPYLIPVPSYTTGDTMPVTCYVNASSSSSLSGPQFPHLYKWVGSVDFSQLFQP